MVFEGLGSEMQAFLRAQRLWGRFAGFKVLGALGFQLRAAGPVSP